MLLLPSVAAAQFKDEEPEKGTKLGRSTTQRIKCGVVVRAEAGNVFRIVATVPVPMEWTDQQVNIVKEDTSPAVKGMNYRKLTGGGGMQQMVVEIPQLAAGQEAHALVTFEVTRQAQEAPTDTSIYHIPKKLDRALTVNIGPSPYIESRHPKIVAAAKQCIADKETDWQKVEAMFDWVRENITLKSGELKGAARAVNDKSGDVDELTSVFVAMCRSQKIPARTVFILGHVYAEFYLEDDENKGHWFPCNPAGARAFGSNEQLPPILQKGDNFKNPENPKERQRYVTEYFSASGRSGKPSVEFISELVAE